MEDLMRLSSGNCTPFDTRNSMELSGIFDGKDSFDAPCLFLTRFNVVPNRLLLLRIDGDKADKWFRETCGKIITECSYVKKNKRGSRKIILTSTCYFLYDDLLINIDDTEIIFLYRKTDSELVERLANEFLRFRLKNKRNKPEIQLLTNGRDGLSTTSLEIKKPKLSIADNYNDDFLPVHQTILKRLSKKEDKGLVLLHGKPGTGKTSYIRYLITATRKNVLFLPPNMAASITSPGLMDVLIRKPDSIFIIEDAENIIMDRNHTGSSAVSALLNLADGLLSDCLNIQIICSFNTDLSRVDSALMRKGRLIAKYEFKELEAHKAQALSDKLGFASVITSPMTLTEVYNQDEAAYVMVPQRRIAGFSKAI